MIVGPARLPQFRHQLSIELERQNNLSIKQSMWLHGCSGEKGLEVPNSADDLSPAPNPQLFYRAVISNRSGNCDKHSHLRSIFCSTIIIFSLDRCLDTRCCRWFRKLRATVFVDASRWTILVGVSIRSFLGHKYLASVLYGRLPHRSSYLHNQG